jgi:hypothetical protein
MSTIAQLVTGIRAAPAPVVFLDTCAILDVARAPARNQPGAVPAAESLLHLARCTPPLVYLLVDDFVPQEWADNLKSARKAAADAVETHSHVGTVAASTGLVTFPVPPPQLAQLPDELEQRSRSLLSGCQSIDRDPATRSAVIDRVLAKRRPWKDKDGRAIKDCHILEHCLAVARSLAGSTFPRWMMFVSSNTADFAGSDNVTLHPDLTAEFAAAGLRYAASLEYAVSDLQKAGEIP